MSSSRSGKGSPNPGNVMPASGSAETNYLSITDRAPGVEPGVEGFVVGHAGWLPPTHRG